MFKKLCLIIVTMIVVCNSGIREAAAAQRWPVFAKANGFDNAQIQFVDTVTSAYVVTDQAKAILLFTYIQYQISEHSRGYTFKGEHGKILKQYLGLLSSFKSMQKKELDQFINNGEVPAFMEQYISPATFFINMFGQYFGQYFPMHVPIIRKTAGMFLGKIQKSETISDEQKSFCLAVGKYLKKFPKNKLGKQDELMIKIFDSLSVSSPQDQQIAK